MNGKWESLQNLSVPKLKNAGLSDSFCVNYPPIRSMPRKSQHIELNYRKFFCDSLSEDS